MVAATQTLYGGMSPASAGLTALDRANRRIGLQVQRIATARRIVRAEDDPAGTLSAAMRMAYARGQAQALANVGEAKDLLQVAEGGLGGIMEALMKMKELAIAAINDTLPQETAAEQPAEEPKAKGNGNGNGGNGNGQAKKAAANESSEPLTEREQLQQQLRSMASEIESIATDTQFNGRSLFDAAGTRFSFHVGARAVDTLELTIGAVARDALDLGDENLVLTTNEAAETALTTIDAAIEQVSERMNEVGVNQMRLTERQDYLGTALIEAYGAYSRIADADMAREQLELARHQILRDTSLAMLAQTNRTNRSFVFELLA